MLCLALDTALHFAWQYELAIWENGWCEPWTSPSVAQRYFPGQCLVAQDTGAWGGLFLRRPT